jgi:hypothetical protein
MDAIVVILALIGLAVLAAAVLVVRRERAQAERERRRAQRAARRMARPRPELTLDAIVPEPGAAPAGRDPLVDVAAWRAESLRKARAARSADHAQADRRIRLTTALAVLALCLLTLAGGLLLTGGGGAGGDTPSERDRAPAGVQ